MANKSIIKEHFSATAEVWRDKIYKPKSHQSVFEYFDKQYRFDYVLAMIPEAKTGNRALDVGCGAGQMIPELAARGYKPYAIDISEDMVRLAKECAETKGVSADVRSGDVEHTVFEDAFFDLYVAMGVIEYLDSDEKILREIHRILKPGALAIVTCRNRACLQARWAVFYRTQIERSFLNMIRFFSGKPPVSARRISREHKTKLLKQTLNDLGFDVVHERYAHFRFLPAPLDRWLKFLEAPVGKWMEKRMHHPGFSSLASTYIVKFKKRA